MNAEAQQALVSLGIKLATQAVERYANRRAEAMTSADIIAAVRALDVCDADELIARGQAAVKKPAAADTPDEDTSGGVEGEPV